MSALLAALALQTDSSLLPDRWKPEPHWADTFDQPFVVLPSRLRETGDRVGVFHWDSTGRIKFDRDQPAPPLWLGYRALSVSVDSSHPALNGAYFDLALALAARLGPLGPRWTLDAFAGLGWADDGAFSEPAALYGTGGLVALHEIDATTRLRLGLAFDGAAELLPWWPLPVVQLVAAPSKELELRAGVPESELSWRPGDVAAFSLRWTYPTNFLALAEARLGLGWSLFAQTSRQVDGFESSLPGPRRVFYQIYRAEAGVRSTSSWIDLSLSAGWAFGQSFFQAYDLARPRANVLSPADRLFVALTLQGTF